jgi:hypothetical protein
VEIIHEITIIYNNFLKNFIFFYISNNRVGEYALLEINIFRSHSLRHCGDTSFVSESRIERIGRICGIFSKPGGTDTITASPLDVSP